MMSHRWGTVALLLAVAGCAQPQAGTPLEVSMRAYPLLTSATRHTGAATPVPRSCPPAGLTITYGGSTTVYGGADPTSPDLCNMRVDGEAMQAWFGIWVTTWPGAPAGYNAINAVIHAPPGQIAAFDTSLPGEVEWHDGVRNDGLEDVVLNGTTYHALKISHFREGYVGNRYRSIAAVWKDLATGAIVRDDMTLMPDAPLLR